MHHWNRALFALALPFTLALVPSGLAGCSLLDPTAVPISSSTLGFSFSYPSDWTKSESGDTVTLVKVPADATKMLGINVSKFATTISASTDVSVWGPAMATSFGQSGTLSASGSTTLGGQAGYNLVLTTKLNSNDVKERIVLATKNNQFYMVQYIASPELYDANASAAQGVIDTFKFL